MRINMKRLSVLLALGLASGAVFAQPSESDIARLGNDLTPVGAERAGNADGTIPAWDGGITSPPAGYSPGDHHPDPFPDDEPLFTITADNMDEYADYLTAGHKAMLQRYASFRMPVYPTRRSASFSQDVYDATIENARTARLTPDGEGVEDAIYGFPFPLADDPKALIWNHKLKFKGPGGVRYNNQAAVTESGNYTLVRLREEILAPYFQKGNTAEDIGNILFYFYQEVESPSRLAGSVLLVQETLNQIEQPRQAWVYNPGQRRVRRAPNVAYDNPGTASDGLRTNDMTDMFNGAMDRFDWEIVGKKEIIVPYNSYKLHSDQTQVSDLLTPRHIDPDYTRYERHRVWVIDARLKEGMRHINARRTMYLDEDSYQIMVIDHYDNRGELVRVSEAHSINYYDLPTFWSTLEVHHDLPSGRYLAVGLDNQDDMNKFDVPMRAADFTPAALRQRGRR